MNATNYYVSTSRVVLQGDPEAAQTWQDLCRTLPILRNSLSCTVCESLLVEPYTPEDTDCEHHVCKGCKGGNKVMKPACSWCKDYSKYFENVQLRILIQNYKKLCGLIKITRLWNIIEKQGDQGKDIMDIVTESEGIKIRRNILKTSVSDYVGTKIKMEKVEVNDQMANVIEPPDEITSSPVSKLSIYRNNPDIKQLDNIKVKLLEELTHLSPGVSPPHSTASSLSSTNNIQKRKIKETFILNPFKGKSDLQGPFKKLDAPPKVQETSLLRKYSLDAYSEKKILFKEEKCSEIEQPQAKVLRLSVDNYAISQSDLDEEVDYTKNDSVLTEPESMDDSIFSKTVEPLSGASEPNKPPGNPKTKAKKSGCRCGNATLCPGKLTCCGQRCPCYVDSMPCIDCKCKGCRNPHMPGGGKMRPALPMLQNAKMKVDVQNIAFLRILLDKNIEKQSCLPTNFFFQKLNI